MYGPSAPRRVEAVCPDRDHSDAARRGDSFAASQPYPAAEYRPYWEYLRSQNRSGGFGHPGLSREAYAGSRAVQPAPFGSAGNYGSPKAGEVLPVRTRSAAQVADAYVIARIVGRGRVIDVVA